MKMVQDYIYKPSVPGPSLAICTAIFIAFISYFAIDTAHALKVHIYFEF